MICEGRTLCRSSKRATASTLTHEFDQLSHAVKLVLFTSRQGCEYCTEIRQIATEVAELSPKLSFEEYDAQQAPEARRAIQGG
jgi:thiol-disulfide isomerase/thioredoxin